MDNKRCLVVNAGLVDYKKALRLQETVFQLKRDGKMPEDVVLLLEHPPTITIGKKGSLMEIVVDREKLKRKGISLYDVGRGGKVTYHGPGQLVGYPLLDLTGYNRDLHLYLRNLEEVIMKALNDFGVPARRKSGLTGVWVQDKKIASIGVQVKSWISMHGFALNVNCDLSYFNLIHPCGMHSEIMTSLANILRHDVRNEDVAERLIAHFARVFVVKAKRISIHQLKEKIHHHLIYS